LVEDEVEPGPDNPLGKYWIGLSMPIVGIHGTNHPITIYSYRTHGCVRLHPDDIEALFDAVDLNDHGEIVYLPLMLARLDDGRIFLESQKDIYRKGTGGIDAVRALADASGIGSLIDWTRAGDVVRDEDGVARDVTLKSIRAGGMPADSNAATTSEPKPSAGNRPSADQPKLESISATLPPH
jgi:L,D-transpeptidase ErfK/SrfK